MSRWSFSSSGLQHWPGYCGLSGAGVAFGYCTRVVFKVSDYLAMMHFGWRQLVNMQRALISIAIRCRARPEYLDDPCAGKRTHELTDALIDTYDPGTLWATEGIRNDVVVRGTACDPSALLSFRKSH